MDKNKNRTDLLAAGRKKLQQFRQKKDNKGSSSHGKSSRKSARSEQHEADTDAASIAAKPEVPSHGTEGEIASHADMEPIIFYSSVSNAVENSIAPDMDTATVDPLSVPTDPVTSVVQTASSHNVESSPHELRVGEHDDTPSIPNEGQSTQTVDEAKRVTSSKNLEMQDSEGETSHADASLPVEVLARCASVDATEVPVTVESENMNREEEVSLSSQEDIPEKSLTQARGYQEADGSGSNQFDRSTESELHGSGRLPLSEHSGRAETLEGAATGGIVVEEATSEVKQTDGEDNVSSQACASNLSDGVSDTALLLPKADGNVVVNSEVTTQQRENLVEKSETLSGPGDSGNYKEGIIADTEHATAADGYIQQYFPEESFMYEDKIHERPLATEMLTSRYVSPVSDVSSISLSQLMEVIRGLGEDEYSFLLKSRDHVSNTLLGTGSLILPENDLPDLLERLKEELYLSNFSKDIFQLQLTEQSELQVESDHQRHQLVDERSVLTASLNEVCEKNKILTEELAQCRSELQLVTGRREELQNLLCTAKAETEELSTRVFELQISLERSQGNLASLSMELTDCKGLVAALQVENEKLNETLASVSEQRRELLEEQENRLNENENLSTKLANCNSLVASLQSENSNLSGSLASVTDERKKVEEEKEYISLENEKLLSELADCKSLAAALQVEYANSNGKLTSVIEERKKLTEDKGYFVHENERLLSELLVLQEQLSTEHGERIQVEVDLKEATRCLEQVTQENSFLNSSLDIHKAKIIELNNRQTQIPSPAVEPENLVMNLEVLSGGHENATDDEDSHKIPGKQDGEVTFQVSENHLSDSQDSGPPLENIKQELFNDAFGFVVLNGHLEDAQKIMHKLEKAIEGIQSHSESLSRQGGKGVPPGVSKLIQAFESRSHLDEREVEEKALIEDRSSADPFMLAKEQTENLRAVLKQLGLDAENASELFKGERDGRKTADVIFRELEVQYEALKEHHYHLEATNIQLGVLYEGVKQHVCNIEAKNTELEVLYEAQKEQEISLKAENGDLGKTLSKYESRVGELQSRLCDLQRSSDEMTSGIGRQLEILQKEAAERVSILEEEWKSTIAHVVETVQKLEEIVGRTSTSTVSSGSCESLDINSRVATSVSSAIKVFVDLQEKLEVLRTDKEAIHSSYEEVNEKLNTLHGKNELAIGILQKLYGDLKKLVIDSCRVVEEGETNIQNEDLLDPVDPTNYETLMEQLGVLLSERLQLESVKNELSSELMSRTKDLEEVKKKHVDLNAINKLIEDVEGLVKLEDPESNKPPVSRLESLLFLLVQKFKAADEQVSLGREECESKTIELTALQEKIHELNALNLQHENQILILKESSSQAEEAITAMRSKLQEKVTELEQSEQRVSSIREKLSIAVSKGKNLVVQRDGLKQSLAEVSSELERCSQELQLKDTRLHEVETKLKNYSEAGERMEALESELSYIRNSATALRESFLLKDSVLQRIEEILEDLELPEHFHSRDIIEKVDWLARSATGNSLPMPDWDQKSSVGGGSYSDTGFVVMDAWKDDAQPSSNSGDDFRRKNEELQSKFYALAEQNEMLEQSLMERNNLVQRWEELLDRINMPSHLRSVEPEDRIEWLGSALSEAYHDRNSLQQKIINLENYCESLNADLEESQRRIDDLEADHQAIMHERGHLSERLEILSSDHEKLSAQTVQVELMNEKLQNEVTHLQETLVEKLGNEEHIQRIEVEIKRLQDLVSDALQDPGTDGFDFAGTSTECLEGLLRKLIENYATLSTEKPVLRDVVAEDHTKKAEATLDEMRIRDTVDIEEPGVAVLKKELELALGELMHFKEERDVYIEKHQSLIGDVEALDKKRTELQALLSQEEQKSASVREKLNVAVRKGKSLVQQRDSLKQIIEEMNSEVENLKCEINHRENAITEYELKISNLSTYPERVKALESESLFLRNRLAETEQYLREKDRTLSLVLNTLGEIDVGAEINTHDPVERLEWIGKLCRDLHAAVTSSEQESRKSKRAAELLLAELNEVQERNDGLQEELAKAAGELTELSTERDVAEAAKLEALSRLENLSTAQSEDRKNQISELMLLKSGVAQIRKGLSDLNNLVNNVLFKDLEFLHNLEAGLESCLRPSGAADVVGEVPFSASVDIIFNNPENKENFLSQDYFSDSMVQDHFEENDIIEACSLVGHHLQDFTRDISALKENLHKHSVSLHEQSRSLSKAMNIVSREMASQKESNETMKRDIVHLESIEKEKDMEIVVLHRNIALLYESCTRSIGEIENSKAEMVGNSLAVGDLSMNMKSATFADGRLTSSGPTRFSSEDFIRASADKLSLAVKDFVSMKSEFLEGSKKEMKITIANLQKELQEKDIQKDRICKELVSQIKKAEAAAASYSSELQSSKTRVHDLEKWAEEMEEERNSLEQRIKELQDGEATSTELQERVRSLTDVLAAKDQEIEALMHALDEEEVQMEGLSNKIEKLEKVVEQKNLDLENLETSRGKVTKKLSITVSKFDELHHLSGTLLSEVEKLQSQLHDRDAEISFLRQEVTRCTNDVLVASQMRGTRNSDEIHEFWTWFDSIISLAGVSGVHLDGEKSSQVHEYKEILQKKITSIVSELEDLRVVAQRRESLLQVERSKVEELTRKEETLKKSLREKESQLNLLQGGEASGRATSVTSEIVEIEPVINKRAVTGTSTAPQVRSLRKVNNDQVAIAIDMDPTTNTRLEDEDDDKVHGFKSLTTSRIVPKFTRPVTDMVDGLWVSCDRALMRQPALRLGIIIYWAVLHALLATFVV